MILIKVAVSKWRLNLNVALYDDYCDDLTCLVMSSYLYYLLYSYWPATIATSIPLALSFAQSLISFWTLLNLASDISVAWVDVDVDGWQSRCSLSSHLHQEINQLNLAGQLGRNEFKFWIHSQIESSSRWIHLESIEFNHLASTCSDCVGLYCLDRNPRYYSNPTNSKDYKKYKYIS